MKTRRKSTDPPNGASPETPRSAEFRVLSTEYASNTPHPTLSTPRGEPSGFQHPTGGTLRVSALSTAAIPWPQAAIRSDVGRSRQDNQDSVFGLTALLPSPTGGAPLPFGFFAVADGMGGLTDGGVASRTAINLISERVVRELLLPALSSDGGLGSTVAEILTAALTAACQAIFRAARLAGSPSGSTFSGVVLLGRQLVVAHVGDSRIYLWGPAGLQQLTEDHSLVGRLVTMGQLTPEEARHNPQRNALYRSLGQTETVDVQSASYPWRGARCLLLCSDGLWDVVGDEELEAALRDYTNIEQAADDLVGLANERGGPDNISVILVQLPQEPT